MVNNIKQYDLSHLFYTVSVYLFECAASMVFFVVMGMG